MLETLRRIVQEVTSANDLTESLQIMVQRVRAAVDTSAATVFLIDNHRAEYVLMATDGLNPEVCGSVRIPLDKGLIGLVGRREEPINLDDAPAHPAYFHHDKVGEEMFSAFLGVPIIHHRRLYGVLVIQQEETRRFDEAEEAFLVTISAQLAGVIAHADAIGALAKLAPFTIQSAANYEEASVSGIPSVSGVAIGTAVAVYPPADLEAVPDKQINDIEVEIALFEEAVDATRDEIRYLSEKMESILPEDEHALFDVYLKLLDRASLGKEVIARISEGHWAQGALRSVIKKHIQQFEAMEDEYLRERASDFRDIGRRILSHLQATQNAIVEYPEQTILVGDEISAANLAEVPEGCLVGIVSSHGSSNSHVAILARALGIPTVMGARGVVLSDLDQCQLVVDGYFGQVYVSPSEKILKQFTKLAQEEQELEAALDVLRDQPAQTPDGHRLALYVNTGLDGDAPLSLSVGAEGVGLFRTEVPFMTRERFPVEEEQRIIYRQLLQAFHPRPVTMRTLDVGGDKSLPYLSIEEENPFLGWRGIRVTLDHPELFLIQVRAMLKASADLENLRILLPMVSGVGELDEALHLINQAYREVLDEGFEVAKPNVGVMVEVPSAVYQAKAFASRVDFLSVGTNDLTQYLLAVDRNNPRVAGLYDALHPAVLQALIHVVEGAHSEGKQASICGEMSSDPVAVILLLAMGFDSLSVNSTSLPRIKWVIRNFSLAYARKLLSEILTMDNAALIRFHLEKALDQVGLGGLIRAGKQ